MENRFAVSKTQIIFALILPLAVLMGFVLAKPDEVGSVGLILIVFGVLSIPIFMRWYHPMLIIGWNACINPYFLPGRPYLWMILAFIGLAVAVANRFTSAEAKFTNVPELNWAVGSICAVTLITGYLQGGFGIRSLGGDSYGGKGYFYILAAGAGFFALVSRRVPANKATLYASIFFLAGVTALVPNIAYLAGPRFEFLFYLFPTEFALEQALADYTIGRQFGRFYGLTVVGQSICGFLLVRYGVRGVFDLGSPWRLGLLVVGLLASVFCGFRSILILLITTIAVQMFFEGLFRLRILIPIFAAGLVGLAALVPFSASLPLPVQRTISFLPVEVAPSVRLSVDGSSEWRLEMWRNVLPLVPQYLLLGKGYAQDPSELNFMYENARRGYLKAYEPAIYSGDFHNGPFSVIIPFGIWGVLAFGFFVWASLRYLHRVYRSGNPEFKTINTFLLAYFVTRIIHFSFVFGSLYTEIGVLASLLGLSVSINGAKAYSIEKASVDQAPTLEETFPSATFPVR